MLSCVSKLTRPCERCEGAAPCHWLARTARYSDSIGREQRPASGAKRASVQGRGGPVPGSQPGGKEPFLPTSLSLVAKIGPISATPRSADGADMAPLPSIARCRYRLRSGSIPPRGEDCRAQAAKLRRAVVPVPVWIRRWSAASKCGRRSSCRA